MATRFSFLSSISCSNMAAKTSLRAEDKDNIYIILVTDQLEDILSVILTCQYGLVRLKLTAPHRERYIAEFLVIEEIAKIFRKFALGHFELHNIGLPGDVYTVRHNTDLTEYCQFIFGQEAVGLVQ